MSDIDFLANQKGGGQEPKSSDHKKEEKIIWSEPNKDKPLIKEKPFTLLSSFGKKKNQDSVPEKKAMVNQGKIKESRREILSLIKQQKGSAVPPNSKPARGSWAGLMARFKRPPTHKEALIDYQQVFNQEKSKRGLATSQSPVAKLTSLVAPNRQTEMPAKPPMPAAPTREQNAKIPPLGTNSQIKAVPQKPAPVSRPAAEEKPLALKRSKESFFSRLFKTSKKKATIPHDSELKSSPETVKKNKPEATLPSKSAPTAELKSKEPSAKQQEQTKTGQPPMEILETNLIKGEIITFFDWQKKIVVLTKAILIPVFIIGALYLGLMFYQKQNQAEAEALAQESIKLTAEVKQAESGLEEIMEFQARLKMVSQIFVKHIYWTNLFKFLEDNTIKDVYYAGFSGDTGGVYSLDAVGTRFSDISRQVGIFQDNEKITEVSTLGGQLATDDSSEKSAVEFNLDFSILKSIFTE